MFKNHENQGYTTKKYHHWSKEEIQEEVNKYQTRGEFQKNSKQSYYAAMRMKNIDELFKNHKNNGYSENNWEENCYVIYVYELKEYNKAYVGLTNNINRRDKEHLFGDKELNKICKENKISYPEYKILEKNLKSIEAKNQEEYWVNFYKNTGWEMLNISKPGSLGKIQRKWNLKILKTEVSKYETRGDFNKNNRNAYKAAMRMNIIDDLFKNHKNNGYSENKKQSGYWSKDTLQNEVNKYQTRKEFIKNSYTAYTIARKMNIIDDLFRNHKNNGYIKN